MLWDWLEVHSSPAFAFLRLLGTTPGETHALSIAPLIRRRLLAIREEVNAAETLPFFS
jgi:chromatin-remodeling ATPase INO80